ncbi:MAG TPA: acyl-CoA thioesterase [Puia sp.]|nr:acyl-CoA thioesterase [Puia sp.]
METKPRTFYTIRFNDCDPFGHLNNSRYIDYFLNAREDHLKEHYSIDLKEWAAKGIGFVVSRHEIQYIRAVSYNDTVCIQSALVGYGDNYIEVEMQMYDKEQQNRKAVLLSKFTQIDLRTGKKSNLTGELEDFARQVLTTRTA